MLSAVFVAATAIAGSMNCPSTPAGVAAGMRITTTANATCTDVLAEMKARVAGQATGAWHDPHNKGNYSNMVVSGSTFYADRAPGTQAKQPVPDKVAITLTDEKGDQCEIEACSRSQVFSVLDFGTNYCNLEMLFCGSDEGCKPVLNDFTHTKETTESFSGSNVELSECLKV